MWRLLQLGLLALGGSTCAAALRHAAGSVRDEPSLAAEAPTGASSASATPAAAAPAPVKKAKPAPGPPKTNWDLYATPESKRRPTMLIPRVLHQTYKGMQLPSKFKQYRETWAKSLPNDWAKRLWTEEELRNLIKDNYPWFLEVYDSYEQDINRIYAARVFLMHQYGGVYADLDIEALHDPTPLFSGDYDLAFFYMKPPKFRRPWAIDRPKGNAIGVVSNAMMASVSKHPFWLFLAQRMLKAAKDAAATREALYSTGGGSSTLKDVLFTTGNSLLTDALAEFQEKMPDAVVGIFSNRYWCPWKMGARDEVCEGLEACSVLHPDALLIHHWAGSWNHCTPGFCLPKPQEVVTSKKKHKRVMPAPPMLPDAPAAMPPPPPLPDAPPAVPEEEASQAVASPDSPPPEPPAPAADDEAIS